MIEAPISKNDAPSGWLFNHLPNVLWQRRRYVIVSFLIFLIAGIVTALALPTVYRSTATLLVQSQDLPQEIAESPDTGSIDRRIEGIRERVLSRGDLISLIEQNDLYPEKRRTDPLSDVIAKMREATTVAARASEIGQPTAGQSDTIAINMSFDYADPVKAQAVLQSYVTRFLQMDSDEIEDQASLTLRFLQDQSSTLQRQIAEVENQLTSLKARNGAALASSDVSGVLDTGSYTAQIADLQSQNRQLIASSRKVGKDSVLAEAEAALASARAMYNDTHPDVVQARERLRALRQAAQAAPESGGDSFVQQQIAANNAAIASLVSARDAAAQRSGAARAGRARAPAILEEAMQLESRANALRDQYKDVAVNLRKAQNSSRMASEQRAERLTLVEPPNLPDQPHFPNRPLVIAGGAVAGLMFGLLLALGVEMLSRPLRSPTQIESMGFPVLGVVPLLENKPRASGWARFSFLKKREKRLA